jgi:coproporphyrinogen III oxidase
MNGRPPVPPGGGAGKTTVLAPKTRLAVGVVFIGALIYSMVQNIPLTKPSTVIADTPPLQRPPAMRNSSLKLRRLQSVTVSVSASPA